MVQVSATQVDQRLEIAVADTGTGIAAEELPHVWERLWQGSKPLHAGGGSGIGLALVKQLT